MIRLCQETGYAFKLEPAEIQRFEEWAKTQPYKPNPFGEQFVFSFAPTSVGVIADVTNETTGDTLLLTDPEIL